MSELFRPDPENIDIRHLTVSAPSPEYRVPFDLQTEIDDNDKHHIADQYQFVADSERWGIFPNWLHPAFRLIIPELYERTVANPSTKEQVTKWLANIKTGVPNLYSDSTRVIRGLAEIKNLYPEAIDQWVPGETMLEHAERGLNLVAQDAAATARVLIDCQILLGSNYGQSIATEELYEKLLRELKREHDPAELHTSIPLSLRLLFPTRFRQQDIPGLVWEALRTQKRDALFYNDPNEYNYQWPAYPVLLSTMVMLTSPGLWIDENGLKIDMDYRPAKQQDDSQIPEQKSF